MRRTVPSAVDDCLLQEGAREAAPAAAAAGPRVVRSAHPRGGQDVRRTSAAALPPVLVKGEAWRHLARRAAANACLGRSICFRNRSRTRCSRSRSRPSSCVSRRRRLVLAAQALMLRGFRATRAFLVLYRASPGLRSSVMARFCHIVKLYDYESAILRRSDPHPTRRRRSRGRVV